MPTGFSSAGSATKSDQSMEAAPIPAFSGKSEERFSKLASYGCWNVISRNDGVVLVWLTDGIGTGRMVFSAENLSKLDTVVGNNAEVSFESPKRGKDVVEKYGTPS